MITEIAFINKKDLLLNTKKISVKFMEEQSYRFVFTFMYRLTNWTY